METETVKLYVVAPIIRKYDLLQVCRVAGVAVFAFKYEVLSMNQILSTIVSLL